MPTVELGKIVAVGTAEQNDLVRKALARSTIDVDRYLAAPVRIEWGETPLVPGTSTQSYAFAWSSQRRIRIRGDQVNRPARAQYLVLHEIAHVIDADHLSRTKREGLMALMDPRPASWGDAPTYYHSPAECFADTFVVAFSDLRSPLARVYKRHIADHAAFRKITRRPGLLHLMPEIRRIESSNRPLAQNPESGASGLYGFMPQMWRETAPRVLKVNPDDAVASADLPPEQWLPEMTVENQERVARSEMTRLSNRFDDDLQKVAASWRNGEGYVSSTPAAGWSRGLVKYVNEACVPLGYDPLPLPEPAESPVQHLVNVTAGEEGLIQAGTPFFSPDDLDLVTKAGVTARFQLVGSTPDGKYRGVVVDTTRAIPNTRTRALLLVEAARVSEPSVLDVQALISSAVAEAVSATRAELVTDVRTRLQELVEGLAQA